jgi:hypothetical protein
LKLKGSFEELVPCAAVEEARVSVASVVMEHSIATAIVSRYKIDILIVKTRYIIESHSLFRANVVVADKQKICKNQQKVSVVTVNTENCV